MQCVFIESSELMFWCTNPSNEVCELSLCEGSFQVLGEEDDIRRSRREKSLSLGGSIGSPQHVSRGLKRLS